MNVSWPRLPGPIQRDMGRLLVQGVRAACMAALLLVGTYYLLASIPFSYYHFLQFPHFWWMPMFIRLHPLVAAVAITGLAATQRELPAERRHWRRYLVLAGIVGAACMTATLLVPGLDSYEVASVLCFLSVGLITAAAILDIIASGADRALGVAAASSAGARRIGIGPAAVAGALSGAAYLLYAMVLDRAHASGLRGDELATAAVLSIAGQMALFAGGALAIVAAHAVAARRQWEPWRERLAVSACVAALLAWLVRRSILTALILSEVRALALAAALGIMLVSACLAAAVRWRVSAAGTAAGPRPWRQWGAVALLAAAIVLEVGVLPDRFRLADWGYTLRKLLVLITWVTVLEFVRRFPDPRRLRLMLAAGLAALITFQVAAAMALTERHGLSAPRLGRTSDLELRIDRYATVDMSAMVLLDLVRPVVSDSEFFSEVWDAGWATDNRSLPAVPLRLSDAPRDPAVRLPNVFIIVIDSLRPDYLSAYNPDVTFTPAMGAFARESLVWRKAFATYAGTALSEPAIWAGGLIQRHQYIRPFSAVNNLERLSIEGGYRRYVSMDAILNTLLEDRSNLVPLDTHIAHPERMDEMYKFDLCTTIGELTRDLDRDVGRSGPVFFFTQPQNMHMRVLGDERLATWYVPRPGGPVMYRPAVEALRRVDGCFGALIDHLKATGMYDDSIIVLTSDHGDAYNDRSLWGHAFYLTPEIIRVPLIIHVPNRLLSGGYWDVDAVALLTDITPTLYALTGYEHLADTDLVGRPLVTGSAAEAQAHQRDPVFLQSSYNLNFALLDGHADWLYVANATITTESYYDMRNGRAAPQSLTEADRVKYHKLLLEALGRMNAHYVPGLRASR